MCKRDGIGDELATDELGDALLLGGRVDLIEVRSSVKAWIEEWNSAADSWEELVLKCLWGYERALLETGR